MIVKKDKNLVVGLILIAAAAAIGFLVFNSRPPVKIDAYSLSGPVTKVSGPEVFLQVTKSENNQLVTEEKNIVVSSDTQFTPEGAKLSDIATSSNIVVYTQDNPAKSSRIRADRIDILK